MDDLDKKARELEAEMRKEAVRRLKTIEPSNPALAEEFRADGTIYVQDISIDTKEGRCFRKANKPEMDVVRYMEDEQGNLPYFIIADALTADSMLGVVYYFLYVSYDKNNWRSECSSYEKYGMTIVEPYAFEVHAGFRMKDDESPINTLFSKFTHLSFNLGKTNSDGRV